MKRDCNHSANVLVGLATRSKYSVAWLGQAPLRVARTCLNADCMNVYICLVNKASVYSKKMDHFYYCYSNTTDPTERLSPLFRVIQKVKHWHAPWS